MTGIYIHIPFCRTACHYCDFHFSTNHSTMNAMEDALLREIDLHLNDDSTGDLDVSSIYFGGGTPSVFPSLGIKKIVDRFQPYLRNCKEITLEANPEDITAEKLKQWQDLGISRLSIGIQSFDQSRLDWMNRKHSAREAEQAVLLAEKAGFQHLSVDLIYGIPDRSNPFESEVSRLLSLPVDHVSAYILTVEQQTVYGSRVKKNLELAPDEDVVQREYTVLCEGLQTAGFNHYEVSNWAKPGGYAIHNQHYWSGLPYLGIGPGAHGFLEKTRFANVSNNRQYIQSVLSATEINELPREIENLTRADRYNETIMTGLRTKRGISLAQLSAAFQMRPDVETKKEWGQIISRGQLVTQELGRFRIPEEHWLLADGIASDLFV
ncbi:MAG: radical SAM family heme chaperone HemW [Flavobacteriales bacterium]